MPLAPRIFQIVALLAIFACIGCGAAIGDTPDGAKPRASYSGRLAELFDDQIVAAAVGVDLERNYTAKSDKRLKERVETAEGILRVRVTTVTAKVTDTGTSYLLGLKTLETMRGAFPRSTFTVIVPSRGDSASILRSFDTRLVGKTFVAFVREFVRPDGDTEIHFHCLPDTQDTKYSIEDSTSFETAVRGPNFRSK